MDALLLLATVSDARRILLGATVSEVLPAGPHGLWMELTVSAGQESLLLTADAALPRIARGARRPAGARSPTPLAAVARRLLPGTRLEALTQDGLDRVAVLEFASGPPGTGGRLIAELFGRQPNLILVDPATGRTLEAVRHPAPGGGPSVGPGAPYLPPAASPRPDPLRLGSAEAVGAILAPALAAGQTPATALRQCLAGLSPLWAQEVAAQAETGSAAGLARALLDLLHRIQEGPWHPRLLLDAAGIPTAAAPLPLRHVPEAVQQPCASLGEAVARLARAAFLRRDLVERQAALRQILHRLEGRLETRRGKLVAEAEAFAQAEAWQRMGEILVAHQTGVPRGATEAALPDHAGGPEARLTIPLDPALSPAANAERLFKRARRARRGAVRVASRLPETEADLDRVRRWCGRLADARDREAVESIQEELALEGSRLLRPQDRAALDPRGRPGGGAGPTGQRAGGAAPTRPKAAGPEPRRFTSSDGLPILVGRDNEGNDYLTLHLARSEDLWLHVQGYGGSHVVVRVRDRKGGIPRGTLVQAAQLAAYYSQARDHGKVAVDYTLRKYVRKPRKSKPGLVTISQEKTIVVSPDKSLVGKLAERSNA